MPKLKHSNSYDHLEILTSTSWHQYQHSHLNTNAVFTQYKSPLQLKVLYIFVEHFIVNKVATYRLGFGQMVECSFKN